MVSEQRVSVSRLTKGIFVLFLALLLQSALGEHLQIFGVVPEVLLVISALCGFTAGSRAGVWFGFVCGCCVDLLFRQTPFALSGLTFAIVGYSCGVLRGGIVHSFTGLIAFLSVFASMIGIVLFAIIGTVVGIGQLFTLHLAVVAVVVGLEGGLLAMVLGPLVRWAFAEPDSPQLRVVRS